ncbi:CRISPR-associated RAMP Cmr6 [hydrothermal vent metagenome]|uniref:CRISPR-associated RAMP Cmr6 n=1 Tax=hydrothermal vent metagenome TaxID=652676 RepID=A0A1W1BEL4_9ZZZZ
MSKPNLGWLFYKEMYAKGDDSEHIKSIHDKLLRANAKDETLMIPHSFKLTTTYPGLIIGSGYAHGIKNDDDSKIGFYFDFTSGVPTLPGSSIKGVLRSLFGYDKTSKNRAQKHKLIQTLLGKEVDVEKLGAEIFDGIKDGESLSIYERDRFYEARAVKTSGALLQDDYITPHKDPLADPNPIKFIKVAGGVTFEFSFELSDTKIDEIEISSEEKLLLFAQLLQFNGVGAKTNVGYGQFEAKSKEELLNERKLHLETIKKHKEQKQKQKEERAKEQKLKEALANASKPSQQVEIAIANIKENKDIYEYLSTLTLSAQDKEEIVPIIEKKIGPKPPKPKNKAAIKWAIKIYEFLGK